MGQALYISESPMAKDPFPKKESVKLTGRWNSFLRYVMVVVAIALFICPDPFTDVLAFWLMGKASISINFKALTGRIKSISRDWVS